MKVYGIVKYLSSVKIIVSLMKVSNDNICFMRETEVDLVEFLLLEMRSKSITPADITKRTGLSASQVSKVLNRESPAGAKAIECFAQALSLPIDVLYQHAGILPKPLRHDEKRQELVHLYEMMNDDNKEDQIAYARMKLEKQDREEKKSVKSSRSAKNI